MKRLEPSSDRAFGLEMGAIAVVSVAICTASDRLDVMTVLVPAVMVLRTVLWTRLPRQERGSVGIELLLLVVCTLLGGFNDWNSVVRHRVYDYLVPHYFPGFSTLPIWMLLYWGLILRTLITFFRWRRIGEPTPRDEVWLGRTLRSPWLKIGLQLVILLVTRQLIYRNFAHPTLSWLPFAAGLVAWLVLFRPNRRTLFMMATFAVLGPAIEVLYIQVGGLHRYHHGVIFGVPIWIALWWLLAAMIWDDFSGRLQLLLGRLAARRSDTGYALGKMSSVDID